MFCAFSKLDMPIFFTASSVLSFDFMALSRLSVFSLASLSGKPLAGFAGSSDIFIKISCFRFGLGIEASEEV